MTVKEYFATGLFTQTEAQHMGERLETLALKGASTVEDILSDARKKSSPFHPHINWDDASAAHERRLQQVRDIANHIYIRVVNQRTGETHETRAFHAVTLTPKQNPFAKGLRSYITIEQVHANPEFEAEVIERARKLLFSWRDRFAEYSDRFGPVFSAISEIEAKAEEIAA